MLIIKVVGKKTKVGEKGSMDNLPLEGSKISKLDKSK